MILSQSHTYGLSPTSRNGGTGSPPSPSRSRFGGARQEGGAKSLYSKLFPPSLLGYPLYN